MMRPGQITCGWAGAERVFRLGLNEIEEIEAAFDRSIFSISQRLRAREASLKEIGAVLRIGLIGGGMEPHRAKVLVAAYLESQPIEENRDAAYAVTLAALMRSHGAVAAEDGETGEPEAALPPGSISPGSGAPQP